VYKSNKPTTITTISASQPHASDNENIQQQQTFMTNAQVPVVAADVTQVATTKSSQSIPSTNIHSTTTVEKEMPSDTSATDTSTEEDEDDEYRKIQKVIMTTLNQILNIE